MSSHQLIVSPDKSSDARIRGERTAGAPATIEIASFPQMLHTRSCGDPDTLFLPLLESSREACRMVERLTGHGENRATAIRLSAMHLASTLLRDSGFSLLARGMAQETGYAVDLDAGTFMVRTRLYASVSRRASFFKVEIGGKIADDSFVVRNPLNGTVIAQVAEANMKSPAFFSSSLAQDCLRAQMEQERFGRMEEAAAAEAHQELRLVVAIKGAKIPVSLRQKGEAGRWDIIDGRRQERVGTLSTEVERPLSQVLEFVQELFSQK
jgi:hypothetical protein